MDEITLSKCNDIPVGTEGRLIDRRDSKIYWVARIKNAVGDSALCWMTQNLDYNYGTQSVSFSSNTQDTAQYYDPGEYWYIDSPSTSSCSPSTSDGLASCTDNGWEAFDASLLQEPTLDTATATKLHYAAGNYYNWFTATNTTGDSSITNGDANGSICPPGWSLPYSGSTHDNNASSFSQLTNGLAGTQLTVAPYYFVYGGYVDNSTLDLAGSNGYYWSATASIASYAYYLSFNSNNVGSSSSISARYYGYSVRCVAR